MQYAHYLYRLEHADAVKDEDGDWTSSGAVWVFVCRCREETNGKGARITLTDGKDFVFGSLIQIPVGNEKIQEGAKVMITQQEISSEDLLLISSVNDKNGIKKMEELTLNGDIRIKGECKKYDLNTYHNRMWM